MRDGHSMSVLNMNTYRGLVIMGFLAPKLVQMHIIIEFSQIFLSYEPLVTYHLYVLYGPNRLPIVLRKKLNSFRLGFGNCKAPLGSLGKKRGSARPKVDSDTSLVSTYSNPQILRFLGKLCPI